MFSTRCGPIWLKEVRMFSDASSLGGRAQNMAAAAAAGGAAMSMAAITHAMDVDAHT